MSLPVKEQATYWGIALAVFFLALWYLGSVMLPFHRRRRGRLFPRPRGRPAGTRGPQPRRRDHPHLAGRPADLSSFWCWRSSPCWSSSLTALINAAPAIAARFEGFPARNLPRPGRHHLDHAPDPGPDRQRHPGARRRDWRRALLTSALGVVSWLLFHRRRAGRGVLPADGLGPHGRPDRRAAAARPCPHHPPPCARD